jgi:PhzF family phenazine biosynthesis protein
MKIFQVDAFTEKVFGGNPAAVCPLDNWLPEEKMQLIAMENNLSETAFFVEKDGSFKIRWFTPDMEIDLCGHATLASAHVIFDHLDYSERTIMFEYAGGTLTVEKGGVDILSMDFPSISYQQSEITDLIAVSLGGEPKEVYKARDLMAVFNSEEDIVGLKPDFDKMYKIDTLGVIATAPGNDADFVSRFFAPRAGISEDPVTGSAHCMLIPFWADRLGKKQLTAQQLSQRKGKLFCEYNGTRVKIAGKAVTYMIGEISI